jgi:hypothetical protein
MKKKILDEKAPKVHSDLKGFGLKVNEFGEIVTSLNIDKINDFLNRNVEDKKLMDRASDD